MSDEIAAAVESGFEEVIEKELIIKEDNFKMSEAAPFQSEEPAALPELEVEESVYKEKHLTGDEKEQEEEETLVETQLQEESAPIEGIFLKQIFTFILLRGFLVPYWRFSEGSEGLVNINWYFF